MTPGPWYKHDTRWYRIGLIAKEWNLDPIAVLSLPRMTRLYMEAWLIVNGMRQEASSAAQQQDQESARVQQNFETRAAAWAQEASRRYRVAK